MLDPFSSQPKSARKKTEKNGASLLDYNYTTLNIDEVYAIYMYKPAITLATKYVYIYILYTLVSTGMWIGLGYGCIDLCAEANTICQICFLDKKMQSAKYIFQTRKGNIHT